MASKMIHPMVLSPCSLNHCWLNQYTIIQLRQYSRILPTIIEQFITSKERATSSRMPMSTIIPWYSNGYLHDILRDSLHATQSSIDSSAPSRVDNSYANQLRWYPDPKSHAATTQTRVSIHERLCWSISPPYTTTLDDFMTFRGMINNNTIAIHE